MPFFIDSGSTHHCDVVSSQSTGSDDVECPPVEDGDVPLLGVPDGMPDTLALLDTALEPSVGVGVAVPAELLVTVDNSVEEILVFGPVIPLLSPAVIEEKPAVDTVVTEAPVVGPVIPLLSLTVIEEKLAVEEAPVIGPFIPLLSLTDMEMKLTVSDPKISGGT
jgi:hypothetical protein